MEHVGFETLDYVTNTQWPDLVFSSVELVASADATSGVTRIPHQDEFWVELNGLTTHQVLQDFPSYQIGTHEVTNEQFSEFIVDGGYQQEEFWKHEFVREGEVLSWEEATAQFRDVTGRSGPSTWEGGTYPVGEADYPVRGISWYEAAAYAAFRGQSLPTAYHWERAALFWQRP